MYIMLIKFIGGYIVVNSLKYRYNDIDYLPPIKSGVSIERK